MKAIFIGNEKLQTADLSDINRDDLFLKLLSEYRIMESHVIYFSAGDAKIKEILIKKDPTFSV
ncbi:MAG: hypothetical protein CVV44_12110 [Spirochaetae bacterium HGW-Spirochaetae-1]|jgi:hypothetical protein|nr:MAG: hypothetical protein CVV44_12110 [Spirochaetae bacterium HGW-Spirochaetae-1]